MPRRKLALLALLALALCAFIVFAALNPYWSKLDVAALVVFAALFVGIAFVTLIARGSPPRATQTGVLRYFRAGFAAFAATFGVSLLIGILALPFVGFAWLEKVLDSTWLWLLLAVGFYPLVLRRLR
jgi:predicted small integral membrane protein